MSIAVAYCRVSTKNQEAALIDHQEQWTEIFKKEGYEFANCGIFYKKNGDKEPKNGLYVDEGISAKEYKKHRKAFQRMIQDAINGKFKRILVEDTTRFARSVEDGMKIVKDLRMNGVDIYFRKENIHSSDVSKDMFLSIYFTIAENEIKTDSNRLKWKQDKLHRAGKWTAPAPYGYNVEKGVLSVDEKENSVIDLIFYLYTEKMLGMRAIAKDLNNRGFRTKKGSLWKSTAIRYILENRIYIGDIVNHKTESLDITRGTSKKIPKDEQIVIHSEDLRIISNETWDKKENIKNKRNEKLKNREGYSTKHELSTLLYCGQCGSTYIRVKKHIRRKGVDKEYEWTCLGHNHYGDIKCKGRTTLEEKKLLECIKKAIKYRQEFDDEYELNLYKKEKQEEIKKINIDTLKEQKENINMQMIELRTEKNKKLINVETYQEQLKQLNESLKNIRTKISKYNNIKYDLEKAELQCKQERKMLDNINLNKLDNSTLKKIFDKIIVIVNEKQGKKYITLNFKYNFLDTTDVKLRGENGKFKCVEYYLGYNYTDISVLFDGLKINNENSRIIRKLRSLTKNKS